jgi:REP element-mobilizing transposase RayT
VTYLITFSSYGARIHGDEAGSVDREHNLVGSRMLDANTGRSSSERHLMAESNYSLDEVRRSTVLAALCERCTSENRQLLAAHVRTNHVHIVVTAEARPEKLLTDLKAYASRCLNQIEPNCKRWARHGSTRWLWTRESVTQAVKYVLEGQGEPMAIFRVD